VLSRVGYVSEDRDLPGWMRPAPWDEMFVGGHKPSLINPRNGSAILGSSTTANVFRGGRHRRVLIDEAASVPYLEDVLRSVDEVGPAVIVSTPKGMGNHFARLIHRKATDAVVAKGDGEAGTVHVRYHYSLDPRKDAAWERQKRAELSDEAWAQEYGLDYQVSAPGRIWPAFDRAEHVYSDSGWSDLEREGWLEGATYYEGWDFGSGRALTCVVWAAYVEAIDTLYLLDYRQWHAAPVEQVAADVGEAGWRTEANLLGRLPDYRVGDIAGKARDSRQQSWIGNLRTLGIDISGQSMAHGRIEWAIQAVGKALRDERLYCAPPFAAEYTKGLPSGVECVEQYRRGRDDRALEDWVGEDEKPLKDIYSHLADALQHIALKVWPRVHQGLTPQAGYRTDDGHFNRRYTG